MADPHPFMVRQGHHEPGLAHHERGQAHRERVSIALSTMWGVTRVATLREFAEKAREFGCSHIELSGVCPEAWLEELAADALDGLDLGVSSVHDPCPDRMVMSDRRSSSYQLAALDDDERRTAVALAKASIDLAARVGGQAVVLHMGTTGPFTADEARLRRLCTEHGPEAVEFIDLRDRLIEKRAQLRDAALAQAGRSLRELAPHAADRGVRLGLENRQDYMELPGIDEMGLLLAEADPVVAGFWYDTGHAALLDRLGLVPHQEWLTRYGSRMVGAHLHDVVGLTDHRAPGIPGGMVPWDLVRRSIPANALKVMEINQSTDEDLLRRSIPFLVTNRILS